MARRAALHLALPIALALAWLGPAAAIVVQRAAQPPADTPVGYASLNGGTNGGAGGKVVTVTTAKAFKESLEDDVSRVVRLDAFLVDLGAIYVGNNKTILGVGNSAGFSGGSLVIKDSKNVIIRNLKMQLCQGSADDCISIVSAKNVWVDHNDISGNVSAPKDLYDGLVDLTHGSSFVTISYNYFHDHWRCTVQGSSDSLSSDGSMQSTMHNNYYKSIRTNMPSVRFGKAHLFNNLYENALQAVSVRMGGSVNLENDVFVNVRDPLISNQSSQPGFCALKNLDFGGSEPDPCGKSKFTKIPYIYASLLLPLDQLDDVVRSSVGVGLIST